MTTYQVYCESCGSDHKVESLDEITVKFCSVCGSELDDNSINSYQDDDQFDEEKDIWDWEDDER